MRYPILLILLFSAVTAKINIHVFPHSHDDAGWKWTYEEYFYKTGGVPKGVKNIITNVVESLRTHPERTYSQVEVSYFKKWWEESATEEERQVVRFMITEGRFTFLNGGFVMADEACSNYQDLIDNERVGLQFLKETFNYYPKTAWQVDPFGHSATYAKVMSEMGFENLVLCRIDEKEKNYRKSKGMMEFFWQPYEDSSQIFTYLCNTNYSAPKPLQILNLEELVDLNEDKLHELAEILADFARSEALWRNHSEVVYFFGGDFTHDKAEFNFKNIEALMRYVVANYPEFNMFYSHPDKYFDTVKKGSFETKKGGDFFPYSDFDYAYWTGYFSSRPHLKGLVKDAATTIQHLERQKLHYQSISRNFYDTFKQEIASSLKTLREVQSINQHHDAVSGTSKERVSQNYENMLTDAISKAKTLIEKMVNTNLKLDSPVEFCSLGVAFDKCEFLLQYIETKKHVYFSNTTNNLVKLRIFSDDIQIFTEDDKPVDYVTFDLADKKYIAFYVEFKHLVFAKKENRTTEFENLLPNQVLFEKPNLIVASSENPEELTIVKDELTYTFSIVHGYFTSYDGTNSSIRPKGENPSGAYVLSTAELDANLFELKEWTVAHSLFGDIRVIKQSYEKSTLITLIDKNGNISFFTAIRPQTFSERKEGVEFVLQLNIDINNNEEINGELRPVMYTDSNGLKMIKRVKDTRDFDYKITEPVASNFYPVGYGAYISGNDNKKATLVTERSVSVGLLKAGQLNMILNRHSVVDDNRGVHEALYESSSWNNYYEFANYLILGERREEKIGSNDLDHKRFAIGSEQKIENSFSNCPFEYDSNCIDVEIFSIDESKVLLQFMNKVDPILSGTKTCELNLNNEKLNIKRTNLSGTKTITRFLDNLKVELKNFETATFLVDFGDEHLTIDQ